MDVDKVISISSVPKYNDEVAQRGVTKMVTKDYANLKQFTDEIAKMIIKLISN